MLITKVASEAGEVLPENETLLDEESYTFFAPGAGLELVVEHLGLQAVCQIEDWSGALVGRGLVFITSAANAEERDRRYYECAFSAGQVVQEFRDEEIFRRDSLAKDAAQIFGFFVNLDERGSFNADVRNARGEIVYEVRLGDSLLDDESSLVEDGFMRHGRDLDGLKTYLQGLDVLPAGAELAGGPLHERRQDQWDQDSQALIASGQPKFATEPPDARAILLALQAQIADSSQHQAHHQAHHQARMRA